MTTRHSPPFSPKHLNPWLIILYDVKVGRTGSWEFLLQIAGDCPNGPNCIFKLCAKAVRKTRTRIRNVGRCFTTKENHELIYMQTFCNIDSYSLSVVILTFVHLLWITTSFTYRLFDISFYIPSESPLLIWLQFTRTGIFRIILKVT